MSDTHISPSQDLPFWDMTPFFPGLDAPEFAAAVADLSAEINRLAARVDELGIGAGWAGDEESAVSPFEELVNAFNDAADHFEYIASYAYAILTIDTRDETAQVKTSQLELMALPLQQLATRLTAWIGRRDVDQLLTRSAIARAHEHAIRTAVIDAAHQLSPAEEELVSELHLSAGSAWNRMYETVTAGIEAQLDVDGETRSLTMPELRLLAYDERREVRRAAYEAELAAWDRHDVPVAAALNGIKGQAATLHARRGWATPLDLALHRNAIDREILDAMMSAAEESFPAFRSYFRAKAGLLRADQLPWYDLFAPVGNSSREWTWSDSLAVIDASFGRFSPRLQAMARRSVEERWVDAPPRLGKTDGAYCTPIKGDVSRILMNFTPSYGSLSTLAHELGHAYHNVCLDGRTSLQRQTPSTLAETASTFCETLVRHAAMEHVSAQDELVILEGVLQDAAQVIVDISSRFRFEQRLFAARAESEVPTSELCRIMRETQEETYGDGLDGAALHPFMWAAKSHYYSVDDGFYNFPYMFGLLFAVGLYGQFQAGPAGFAARYDDLLSATGMDSAATLAARFGIDLRTPEFWRSSLAVIRADIARYVELARAATGAA